MEQIGKSVGSALACSRPNTVTTHRTIGIDDVPIAFDPFADVQIPDRVCCSRSLAGVPEELRRALTVDERAIVQRRVDALAPAMVPYMRPQEDDRVAAALDELLASFGTMGVYDQGLAARIHGTMNALADFPAWAIERACLTARRNGYEVEENGRKRIEQKWAPNDPQLHALVEEVVHRRRTALLAGQALLKAPVQQREPERDAPSVADTLRDFHTRMSHGYLLEEAEQIRRDQAMKGLADRERAARVSEYVSAGLDAPTGKIITSLPMMLKAGYTIEQVGASERNVLIAPPKAKARPKAKSRQTEASEMGS